MTGVDVNTVVLAASTAIVGITQLGIVMTSRTRDWRDTVFIGLITLAVVALFVFAWIEIAAT